MTKELFAFYNVENFYPADENSPGAYPCGLYNWDLYKYGQKVRKIGNVFRFIQQDYDQLPCLVGLAEIGGRSVLDDLTRIGSPLHDYGIIYEPSGDPRHLSVALLFDQNKMSLLRYRTLQLLPEDNGHFSTRDVLHAELLYRRERLHMLVAHLPSQRERDTKKGWRHHILGRLHELLQGFSHQDEPVILIGDFNENPDSPALQTLLSGKDNKPVYTNPFVQLFREHRFSTYHGSNGLCFDQMIFPEALLKERLGLLTVQAEIYSSPRLRNKDHRSPARTYSGSRYIGGYSDHYPILLLLHYT